MKRYSSAAGLALAVVAVLGLAGPAAAGEQVPFKGSLEGDVTVTPLDPAVRAGGSWTPRATRPTWVEFTLDIPHVVNRATRTAIGSYEFTAANGDTVYRRLHRASHADGDTRRPLHRGNRDHHGRHGPVRRRHRELHRRALFDTIAGTTIGSFEGTISSPRPLKQNGR